MNPEHAHDVAQQALVWLIGRPDALGGFLAASGASVADLRPGADDPDFLGSVLDFILQSDDTVLDFATDVGLAPDLPGRARAALPGGYTPDWT
jgi:Protein of unknown function (DUF3572)